MKRLKKVERIILSDLNEKGYLYIGREYKTDCVFAYKQKSCGLYIEPIYICKEMFSFIKNDSLYVISELLKEGI